MSEGPDERPLPRPTDDEPAGITLYEGFAGPLPPPQVLRAYREAIPDAPERILDMAEAQARHRMRMDGLGLAAAVAIAALATVPGVLLAVTDQPWPIRLIGLAPVVVIGAVFARYAIRPG